MNDFDRETRSNINIAESIQRCLQDLNEMVVFAESCTGGEIVSTMAKLPGISSHMCGSFVTYRPVSKQDWIGVDAKTISQFTTESIEVAREMSVGSLKRASEASWSLAIVGHLGPNAPEDKDGVIYICISRRTKKGNIKVKDEIVYTISNTKDRIVRQRMATQICLTGLARALLKKIEARKVA